MNLLYVSYKWGITGGLVKKAEDLFMVPLVNVIKAKTLPWIRDDINILQFELGEYIVACSAATIALDKSFDDLF